MDPNVDDKADSVCFIYHSVNGVFSYNACGKLLSFKQTSNSNGSNNNFIPSKFLGENIKQRLSIDRQKFFVEQIKSISNELDPFANDFIALIHTKLDSLFSDWKLLSQRIRRKLLFLALDIKLLKNDYFLFMFFEHNIITD